MATMDYHGKELVFVILLFILRYVEAVRKLKYSGVHCDRTIHLCFVPGVLCYVVSIRVFPRSVCWVVFIFLYLRIDALTCAVF